jgi:GAF domain-containing protein
VADSAAYRSVLGVPMLLDGEPIGSITVYRDEAGPFPDSQIRLLKTFVDQAVIAIRNVRMFEEIELRNRDLTESLGRQTATSEILRVISQSRTDVLLFSRPSPTRRTRSATASVNVYTFTDGTLIHATAFANPDREAAEAMRNLYPRPPGRRLAAARCVLTKDVVVIPDVLEDPHYGFAKISIPGGFRSILSVPLMRGGEPIGAIAVGRALPGISGDADRPAPHICRPGGDRDRKCPACSRRSRIAIVISPRRWSGRPPLAKCSR